MRSPTDQGAERSRNDITTTNHLTKVIETSAGWGTTPTGFLAAGDLLPAYAKEVTAILDGIEKTKKHNEKLD